MRNILLLFATTTSMIFTARAFTAALSSTSSSTRRRAMPLSQRLSSSSSSSSNADNKDAAAPSSSAMKRIGQPPQKNQVRKTQLRTDLKQYRIQQSAPLKKPAFSVFTNAVLEEIYATLPTTLEELLQVKGIGPKKIDMFGGDILMIVSQYTDANGALRSSISSSSNNPQVRSVPRPVLIDPKSLTPEQRQVADLLLSSDRPNVFVTGSAGTGKSHVLKFLVQELQRRKPAATTTATATATAAITTDSDTATPVIVTAAAPKVVVGVCAPTGVAAIHVGGSTLHSFFGIGLGNGSLASLLKKVKGNADAQKRIDETDVLIIDECSMLSSDLLETLDDVVRHARRDGECSDQPFGGMQVICFGDFFQLPPVSRSSEKPFCFDSPVWSELGLAENMVELQDVQRQANGDFVDLLNKVRIGMMIDDDIQELNQRCVISDDHSLPTDGILPTRLYVLNKDVDTVNESRLVELEGNEVICHATNNWREHMPTGTLVSVKKKMAESLSKQMPDEVRLKVGAQVMLTRNKDLEKNLVNGSRGVVVRFEKANKDGETVIPVVRFDCGVVQSIAPVESVGYNPDGGAGCLVRLQVPLKLAWAITVHKSQGTTLTRALLDISSAFEYGQCYVALSRVKSLEGLWLEKPARLRDIKVSPQVLDFYGHKRRS